MLLARLPPIATEILAGYIAGSAKTLAFYPLDTITTLREVRAAESSRGNSLLRFYAGLPLTLIGALPYAVVFHAAFWLVECALAGLISSMAATKLLASVGGAIAAAIVGVPFECLKHRVQLGVAGYASPRAALASTLRSDGIGGLYVGLRSTLCRNVPYNALHFGLFELISQVLRGAKSMVLPGDAADALAGAIAGALTALLTTPMDLVNTRLQTQAMSGSLARTDSAALTNFTGVGDAFVTIWRDEGGPAGLMQGAGVRVLQYAPSALVFFAVYSAIKRAAVGV